MESIINGLEMGWKILDSLPDLGGVDYSMTFENVSDCSECRLIEDLNLAITTITADGSVKVFGPASIIRDHEQQIQMIAAQAGWDLFGWEFEIRL